MPLAWQQATTRRHQIGTSLHTHRHALRDVLERIVLLPQHAITQVKLQEHQARSTACVTKHVARVAYSYGYLETRLQQG
jgi:hypothetical protein